MFNIRKWHPLKHREGRGHSNGLRPECEQLDDRVVLSSLVAPMFNVAATSATQVNLTWRSVAGAAAYRIDECINGNWVLIASMGSHANSYAVNGLVPDTIYNLRVGASSGARTAWAQQKTVTTPAAPLSAPAFLICPVSTTQIAVCWAPVSGATVYIVGAYVNGAWQCTAVSGSSNMYIVSGLAPNAGYAFDVAALNAQGGTWGQIECGVTNQQWWAYDHPDSLGSYAPVTGSLFGPSGQPQYLDVRQGGLGDCWLLASLAATAARYPSDIANMFTYLCTTVENGAVVNVYNVRFFDSSGKAEYVTVDTELPMSGGYCIYDNPYYSNPTNGVLWVALAEKAYVQANRLGYVQTGTTTQSYNGYDTYLAVNGGLPEWAIGAITGKWASEWPISSNGPSWVASDWTAGDIVVIWTGSSCADSQIVPGHAYAVVGYNASSSTPFEVYNPWGPNPSGYKGLWWADANCLSNNFYMEDYGPGMGVTQISTSDKEVLLGVLPMDSVGQQLPKKQIKSADHTQSDYIQNQLLWDVALERAEQPLHVSGWRVDEPLAKNW